MAMKPPFNEKADMAYDKANGIKESPSEDTKENPLKQQFKKRIAAKKKIPPNMYGGMK